LPLNLQPFLPAIRRSFAMSESGRLNDLCLNDLVDFIMFYGFEHCQMAMFGGIVSVVGFTRRLRLKSGVRHRGEAHQSAVVFV